MEGFLKKVMYSAITVMCISISLAAIKYSMTNYIPITNDSTIAVLNTYSGEIYVGGKRAYVGIDADDPKPIK